MKIESKQIRRSRLLLCLLLVAVILAGLASRKFGAALPQFVADNAGDALWTVAAYLGLAWLWPRVSPLWLGLGAFSISVGVECSQLVDVGWLNRLRSTTIGRLLLGSGFIWIDFARYFVGALSAAIVDWVTCCWSTGFSLRPRTLKP